MKINILGYGQMAKQIAALFYLGGHDVAIWNHREVDAIEVNRHIKLLNRFLASDKTGTVTFVKRLEELQNNFTIESICEDLNSKKVLFSSVSATVTKGYYTNSSSYSPCEIGDGVGGLHFYNPIHLKIVEFCTPARSIPDEAGEVVEFLEVLGYEMVQVNKNRGYIGNYILFHEISSVLKLIEKNEYVPDSIISLYNKLYEGRNIFNIIDIIGIDVVYKILQNLKEKDDSIYLPFCLKEAIDKNILGKKNKTSICSILKNHSNSG